jgi:DNA-binding CsgD family transcriptional regulator
MASIGLERYRVGLLNETAVKSAFRLSDRELDVAKLIAAGMSPKEASRRLNIQLKTVRSRLKTVFEKTDTHRQNELVALLVRVN